MTNTFSIQLNYIQSGDETVTGGGGVTHKRAQPLFHKSFPYWHDRLRRNMVVIKQMDEEPPAVQNNTERPVLRCHEDWDTGVGGREHQHDSEPVRRMG